MTLQELIQVMESRYHDLMETLSEDMKSAKEGGNEDQVRAMNTLLLRIHDEYVNSKVTPY